MDSSIQTAAEWAVSQPNVETMESMIIHRARCQPRFYDLFVHAHLFFSIPCLIYADTMRVFTHVTDARSYRVNLNVLTCRGIKDKRMERRDDKLKLIQIEPNWKKKIVVTIHSLMIYFVQEILYSA